MKKLFFGCMAALVLSACGGGKVDPEVYLEEKTTQATAVDEYVGAHLAYKSLADYKRGNELWNVQVGYMDGKLALVKMVAADNRQQKWWIYADSATGKAVLLKEETKGKDGKGVRNMFAFLDTALINAKAGAVAYQPENDQDFRMKFAEVDKLMKEVVAAAEVDRADLSKAANDARRDNAQFFAAGNEPNWSLVINPSKNEIVLSVQDAEAKRFTYTAPDNGPMNESIYELRSLNDKVKITVASKWCTDMSGKVYPYSVVIDNAGKAISGCGILLQ